MRSSTFVGPAPAAGHAGGSAHSYGGSPVSPTPSLELSAGSCVSPASGSGVVVGEPAVGSTVSAPPVLSPVPASSSRPPPSVPHASANAKSHDQRERVSCIVANASAEPEIVIRTNCLRRRSEAPATTQSPTLHPEHECDYFVLFIGVASLEFWISISTRRLFARPSAVLLSAIGSSSPL